MPKGAVQFVADSSQLRRESGAAAKSIASIATSAEDARKRIVDSFQMQVKAAKDVGASQRELESITRRTATMLANVTEDNANKVVKALGRIEDSTKRVAEARKKLSESLAIPVVSPTDHSAEGAHGITDQQRASALLRAGGGTFSIRAGEQFTSQFALFNKISTAVFPIVGAAVFATEIAHGIEQIVEFKKQVDEIPEHIRSGFGALNVGFATTNDELKLTNDTLQNSINKLEHKPQNQIAIALDEARLAADRFAQSIEADNEKLDQLLSKNHLSGWALLFGRQGTAEREGTVSYYSQKQADAGLKYQQAIQVGDQKAADKALADLHASQQSELKNVLDDRSRRQASGPLNNDANVAIDTGVATAIVAQQNHESELLRNARLSAQQKDLQARQDGARQAQELQRQQLQSMEAELNQRKIVENLSIKQVYDYWNSMRQAFSVGSEAYNSIVSKQAELAVQGAKEADSRISAFRKSLTTRPGASEGNEIFARYDSFVRQNGIRASDERTQRYVDSNNFAISGANNSERQEEADILSRVGRSLTQYDSVLQIATARTKEFSIVQQSLEGNLNALIDKAKTNPTPENEKAVTQARIALENARADFTRQQQAAQLYGQGTSGSVGLKDSINEFVFASRDSAAQTRNLFQGTITSLNQAFVAALSGKNVNFGDVGSQIFSNIAGTALTKAEGSIFGAFGFGGKADGSTGNPFHVVVDGTSGALSTAGSLLGKAGSNVGGFLSKAFNWLPGRALGGGVDANGSYVVGEREPEVLTMGSSSGRITPVSQLGSGESHYYTVDARGSNDPAATEAAVARGIAKARPGIIASAVAANMEFNRRRPSTVRS